MLQKSILLFTLLLFILLPITNSTLREIYDESEEHHQVRMPFIHYCLKNMERRLFSLQPAGKNPKCEEIKIEMCSNFPYNMTIYPNLLKHSKQKEAEMDIKQFVNYKSEKFRQRLPTFI